MNFKNISDDELSKFKDERILFPLSRNSPLLDFLRAMYSLMLDYGVYLGDNDAEPLIFSKDQLVFLIERGNTELLLKDLPEVERTGVINAIKLDEFVSPDKIQALIIERRGVSIGTLSGAFSPDTANFPEWWTAPIPFAMCGRRKIKLNPAAISEFGADLERLNVSELPEKDEFIVELDGREKPFFMSFRRLAAGIFAIEDCTGDLVEAQDISWWAGLGRLWVDLITAGGRHWRRLEDVNDLDDNSKINKNVWPCEWQGRFMGYFCIDDDKNSVNSAESVESVKSVKNIGEDTQKDEDKINVDNMKSLENAEVINKGMENIESFEGENIRLESVENMKIDDNIEDNEVKNGINNVEKNVAENVNFESAEGVKTAGETPDEPEKMTVKKGKSKGENAKKSVKKAAKKDVKGVKKGDEDRVDNADKNVNDTKEAIKDTKEEIKKDVEDELNDDKNDILRAISPQTLGLLAPGLDYNYYDNVYQQERERERVPVKRRIKGDLRL